MVGSLVGGIGLGPWPGGFVGFWQGIELVRSSGSLGVALGKGIGKESETFVAAESVVSSQADPGALCFQPGLMVPFLVSLASFKHCFQKCAVLLQ